MSRKSRKRFGNLFCTKNLFSAVCEAFSLIQVKVSFVFILFDRTDFPCFVLRPGLWVKKHDGLSLSEGELLQWNTLIKMNILTVTLFWQFKACVLCLLRFLKEESEISIQKDFGHMSYTQICGKWKQVIHYWQPGKNKPWQKKPTD